MILFLIRILLIPEFQTCRIISNLALTTASQSLKTQGEFIKALQYNYEQTCLRKYRHMDNNEDERLALLEFNKHVKELGKDFKGVSDTHRATVSCYRIMWI